MRHTVRTACDLDPNCLKPSENVPVDALLLTGNSSPARLSLPLSYLDPPFPSSNLVRAHPEIIDHVAPRTCNGMRAMTRKLLRPDAPVENLLLLLRTNTPVLEQQIKKLALPCRVSRVYT